MKRVLKSVIKKLGYKISKSDKTLNKNPFSKYEYGEEAYAAIKKVSKNTMVPEINLLTLYEQVVYCEKNQIPGDFVECGVWKGGAVGMMAIANQNHGVKSRDLRLFDAFDDICEPDPEVDGDKAFEHMLFLSNKKKSEFKGRIEPVKGVYNYLGGHGTIAICNELLVDKLRYNDKNIYYYKGWFEKTMKEYSEQITQIAILRLDGDWYSSTRTILECLFDKVVPGGVIIVDDYGTYDGCRKAVNEFMTERNIKTFLSYSDYSCRYFVKS